MCLSKVTVPLARYHQARNEGYIMKANGFPTVDNLDAEAEGYRLFLKYGDGYHSLFVLDRQKCTTDEAEYEDKEYYKNNWYKAIETTSFGQDDHTTYLLGFFIFPGIEYAKKYLFSILKSGSYALPPRRNLEDKYGTNTDHQIVMCKVRVDKPCSFGVLRPLNYISEENREEMPVGCFGRMKIIHELTPREVAEERIEC